jgi:hypothetical protein
LNLNNSGSWRAPIDELIPMSPVRIVLPRPHGTAYRTARLLVSGQRRAMRVNGSGLEFETGPILDHEVAVIS